MATETPILLHSTSGPDGKLHLVVPVGKADAEFEVELIVRPKLRRPPGYSALFNSIDDETFDVPPEQPMPPPVEID